MLWSNEDERVLFGRAGRKASRMVRRYRSAPGPDAAADAERASVAGLRANDRRRAERWGMDADVEITAPDYQRATPINASKTGVRVATRNWIPAGTQCDVRFRTRSGRVLLRRALVVWARREADGCLLGMHFIGRFPLGA